MKFVLFTFLISCTCGITMCNSNVGHSWIKFLKHFQFNLNECFAVANSSVLDCFQNASWSSFDEVMSHDVVPLTSFMRLVRFRTNVPFKERFDRILKLHELNNWKERILAKFYKVFSTHKLQIDREGSEVVSSRGRHRRKNQMLPAMMFGITALGMVLVPIGFQFLSIVVGKAFLMAKLALILASINGLKRIASSGVNFGLYQIPEPHAYYDRDGAHQPI